ncbi:Peptidase family M50 [uncultured archaeon]|nr:Peptidase family M50 [uncultured archaeon]
MQNKNIKLAFATAAVLVTLAFFLIVLDSQLSAILKFVLAAGTLAVCGIAIATALGMDGWGGLYMLRSKHGLDTIDSIARRWPGFWELLAEMGMVVAYGSFAYFLMAKKKRTLANIVCVWALGTFFLVLLSALLPVAMNVLLSMVSGGAEFAGAGAQMQGTLAKLDFVKYVSLALMMLGGIALTVTASIVAFAAMVASAFLQAAMGNSAVLANTQPGGMPILPGINLDLVTGVIALAIVLVVHEGMHGILARIYKLPLTSAGLVFFGFLPFGAFVDINEKKLFKEKREKQNAVFVAGTTANFTASIVVYLMLLLFVSSTEGFRVSGVYVDSGTLPHGTVINSINGVPIYTLLNANLSPNTTYSIETSSGVFERTTDAKGRIGIMYVVADRSGSFGALRYAPEFSWMQFVLEVLGLTFALNIVVASVNLVPLPLFDGYYLMKNAVGNNRWVVTAITYLVSAAFLLTLLPWILK